MDFQSSWTVYRTRFLVRARQLTEPLVFTDALNREQSGRPGDYLVETSEGIRRIITKMLFEDIYVPIERVPLDPAQITASAGVQRGTAGDEGPSLRARGVSRASSSERRSDVA